jgi:hypothetical protein
MSNDPLATYRQDHLAGAASAIELLEMLRDQHEGESVGALATQLVAEVEADRGVLDALARRVAEGSSLLKDATGWLGAKISQLKLGRQAAGTPACDRCDWRSAAGGCSTHAVQMSRVATQACPSNLRLHLEVAGRNATALTQSGSELPPGRGSRP